MVGVVSYAFGATSGLSSWDDDAAVSWGVGSWVLNSGEIFGSVLSIGKMVCWFRNVSKRLPHLKSRSNVSDKGWPS